MKGGNEPSRGFGNLSQTDNEAERLIDRVFSGEETRDIGREEYNIRAFSIAFGILTANAIFQELFDVIFGTKLVIQFIHVTGLLNALVHRLPFHVESSDAH